MAGCGCVQPSFNSDLVTSGLVVRGVRGKEFWKCVAFRTIAIRSDVLPVNRMFLRQIQSARCVAKRCHRSARPANIMAHLVRVLRNPVRTPRRIVHLRPCPALRRHPAVRVMQLLRVAVTPPHSWMRLLRPQIGHQRLQKRVHRNLPLTQRRAKSRHPKRVWQSPRLSPCRD